MIFAAKTDPTPAFCVVYFKIVNGKPVSKVWSEWDVNRYELFLY